MRRRALPVAVATTTLVVLALAVGCSMLSEFEPAVDTEEMRAGALASRFVDGPGGRIHVVVAGRSEPEAPRVLFVHGSPGTWEAWRGFLTDPSLRTQARLLAPDRPGFGGTARGLAEPSLARQAAALAAVLDAEPGPPAVVAGHSLGGPIAVRLAFDRPDLVSGLVLVAPSIDPALERRRWYNVAASLRVVQWFLPVDWVASNRELWPLAAELEAMRPHWPRLSQRVIVVQGEADELVPAANADFARRMVPAGRLDVRLYPGEGHFILWQRPATVAEPIGELLAGEARVRGRSEGESAP